MYGTIVLGKSQNSAPKPLETTGSRPTLYHGRLGAGLTPTS